MRAVLLDALGTLLQLKAPAPRLREELRQRCGIEIAEALADRAIAAEIAYYRAHLNDGRDERSLEDLHRRCAAIVAQALSEGGVLGLPGPEEMTQILLASIQFRQFDDVEPALRELKQLGLRLVVVSNWDVSLHAVLERHGVTHFLDAIVTSAEVGAGKPRPEIFGRALALAGVGAAAARHVGDSLQEDVAGARAAGIEPILICRDRAPASVQVPVITSLAELPPLVEFTPE